MTIEKMKILVSRARFEEALVLGETYLPTATEEKPRLLQLCLVCARNLSNKEAASSYYKRFMDEVKQHRTIEEEVLYLHVQILYLFYMKQEQQANAYLKKFIELFPSLVDKEEALYTYAAMIYYKILYFIDEKRFLEAVKLYNQIENHTIETLYNQNPALYLYIHAHLAGAYMQLGKWRTARQLLEEIRTVSVIDEKPYMFVMSQLMRHLLDYLLDDQPLNASLIAEYYKKLQPMTVFHRQLLQRDIGKINEKKPSPLLAAFTKHPIETPIMD